MCSFYYSFVCGARILSTLFVRNFLCKFVLYKPSVTEKCSEKTASCTVNNETKNFFRENESMGFLLRTILRLNTVG